MTNFPKREDLQLIALDLDGTVICSQGLSPISPRTRQAVKTLQESGLPVTFVTGRTEDYAAPIAREFDIDLPLVTYNGARLYSPKDSTTLYAAKLESELCVQICDWLQSDDEVVACYLSREDKLHLVQSRCSGRPGHDDHLFGTPRHLVPSISKEIEAGDFVSKIIISTQRPLAREIGDKFGLVVQAVRTHPELVEILPLGVSKGAGVLRLCEHLKMDPKKVLAVGDQENDISTFEVCGFSVAMGDAPEQVKASADFVTGDFSEDGCAQALEHLF